MDEATRSRLHARAPSCKACGIVAPLTRTLILVNTIVFCFEGSFGDRMIVHLALWPIGHARRFARLHAVARFEPWQLLTSSFLHATVMHLLLNMFALYVFGRDVERVLGSSRYLRLYTASVLSAALVQLAVVSFTAPGHAYPTIGASGGVFGVLLAFAMLFPGRIVTPLFPPIPMPAWLFVGVYGLIELANGVAGTEAGVAHFAHLGGMLGAYLLLRRWHRGRRRRDRLR
jgi:membrane associated rhomboid family serine protease